MSSTSKLQTNKYGFPLQPGEWRAVRGIPNYPNHIQPHTQTIPNPIPKPYLTPYPTPHPNHTQPHTQTIPKPIPKPYPTPYPNHIQPHTQTISNPIPKPYPLIAACSYKCRDGVTVALICNILMYMMNQQPTSLNMPCGHKSLMCLHEVWNSEWFDCRDDY